MMTSWIMVALWTALRTFQHPKVIFDALTPDGADGGPGFGSTLPPPRSRQAINKDAMERDGRARNVNMATGLHHNSLMSTWHRLDETGKNDFKRPRTNIIGGDILALVVNQDRHWLNC